MNNNGLSRARNIKNFNSQKTLRPPKLKQDFELTLDQEIKPNLNSKSIVEINHLDEPENAYELK